MTPASLFDVAQTAVLNNIRTFSGLCVEADNRAALVALGQVAMTIINEALAEVEEQRLAKLN